MAFFASLGRWSRLLKCAVCCGPWLLVLCAFAPDPPKKGLRTKNVIIVVIDGPRYSETWDSIPGLIPNMATRLKPRGVLFSQFYNNGFTYTNSGHAAITTGIDQAIDNFDQELPQQPSIFQLWRKATGKPATAAWLITSKDKLHILANTLNPEWKDQLPPSLDCGVGGPGTGYRADSLTLVAAKRILTQHKPNLVLINFMEPDGFAHAANWPNYVRGIARDDKYVMELYDFLRRNKAYRNNTTLLITNDHGRHLNSVPPGWVEHGDGCEGCRHISLLALGPDFKKGRTIKEPHTLLDIPSTVAYLLGFPFAQGQGKPIEALFKR
ncbi:sulfatase-like hydrolase/transferase [Hymenobacter sp. BT683]|uniref:Sulfatase-like hydrolase/transferase n=1 Tax=Hymenobacter jeongseonensis TaxID=2791027 RepID=A0ABS0II67_9BACT|nr:sulfatase-like hydrolase/transferase [Hymenobacter jeongseonensis]MBF9238036.1 sulfatase-like hydrolase/transferase [Hymenobacter jeongseonensis]